MRVSGSTELAIARLEIVSDYKSYDRASELQIPKSEDGRGFVG